MPSRRPTPTPRTYMQRSPADNINMPPALLSRFDIMWLMLDKRVEDTDRQLAEHIVGLHQGNLSARVSGVQWAQAGRCRCGGCSNTQGCGSCARATDARRLRRLRVPPP
jgi:hypothetical protein